jgi:hypothetical protein
VRGLCLGRADHASEARTLLNNLSAQKGGPFISSLELARIAAGLHDRDRCWSRGVGNKQRVGKSVRAVRPE